MKNTKFFILFTYMLIAHAPSSSFAIMDNKSDGIRKPPPATTEEKVYDTSCTSIGENNILRLPNDEMIAAFTIMSIDFQIGAYLCARQTDQDASAKLLANSLEAKFPTHLDAFKARLAIETKDQTISDLLVFFISYGIGVFDKIVSIKNDYLTIDELPFNPETSRFLVSKAEEINDDGQRNFMLDFLIPLLPPDEAMARQAKREEARKKTKK